MPYFPAFIDLRDKNVLVVGGGSVARRKIEGLLPFSPRLRVVARSVAPSLREMLAQKGILFLERDFVSADLDGQAMVIVAVDDVRLQGEIFTACEERKIFCNSVDSERFCSFLFPALVVRGDLTVGVNTAGKAPAISSAIRKRIESVLPDSIAHLIQQVDQYRSSLPPGPERQKKVIEFAQKIFIAGVAFFWVMAAAAIASPGVFMQKCWGCHHMTEQAFGPPFAWIARVRDDATIRDQLRDPEKTAQKLGYARNAMPKIPLEEREIDEVLALMGQLRRQENGKGRP